MKKLNAPYNRLYSTEENMLEQMKINFDRTRDNKKFD